MYVCVYDCNVFNGDCIMCQNNCGNNMNLNETKKRQALVQSCSSASIMLKKYYFILQNERKEELTTFLWLVAVSFSHYEEQT